MLYEKVTKRCSAVRLSKEEARESLARQFTGSEILELHRRGDKWVATLLMPKQAEFPPKDDDDGEEKSESKPKSEGDSEGSADSGASEGPPKADKPPVPGEEGPGPGGLEHTLAELSTLVHAIADHMGIGPGPDVGVPGAEDPMAPPGPPMPPPAGPPGAPPISHQEITHKTKLKPGDTPPGVTPIGSPAFSSIQRMASFDAFDDTPGKSIKEAKAELEELYGPHGFKVRQIKRVENGTRLAAKLSRR